MEPLTEISGPFKYKWLLSGTTQREELGGL